MKNVSILTAVIALLTLFCKPVAAQEFHLGLEAGGTISNASWKLTDGYRTKPVGGFTIGATAEFEILDNTWLQTGITFLTKGGKSEISAQEPNYPDIIRTITETYRPMYIQLPINVAYKVNIKGNFGLFVAGGCFIAQGIGGEHNVKNTFNKDWQNTNENHSAFANKALKRFDCGLNIGAGLELGKLVLRAGYDWSILNIAKNESVLGTNQFKNRSFAIALGLKLK